MNSGKLRVDRERPGTSGTGGLSLSCIPVLNFIAKFLDYFISVSSLVNDVKPEELEVSSRACSDQAVLDVD